MTAQEQHQVWCAGCESLLDEPTDLAVESRAPCVTCGSTARKVSVTLHATVGEASASGSGTVTAVGHPTGSGLSGRSETRSRAEGRLTVAVEVLPLVARRLDWTEPTEPGGSYTLRVYDEADHLIGMTEDPSWRKALYALRAALGPGTSGGDESSP